MKEGISKHKALLGICDLYEISSKDIYELRNASKNCNNIFNILPKHTINTNKNANNEVIDAEYFLQFIGFSENEDNKYILFNIKTIDNLLNDEINNCGIDDILKNFDFKKILSVFKPNAIDDFKNHVITNVNYIIFELEYITSRDYEFDSYDCDVKYNIIGYLDENLNIIYFN